MKVKINNYQIIEDIDLEFVQGVNAIVGSTNNGKSSVIRAIKGAINNQGGSGFINYNAEESVVDIEYNNNKVIWTKSKKQGRSNYNINGEVYNKIGQTQLPEVADIFNMPEISVGTERFQINFWKQLDKPFLVDRTAYQLFDFISQSKEQEQVEQLKQQTEKEVQKTQLQINNINVLIDMYNKELASNEGITELNNKLSKYNTNTLSKANNILTTCTSSFNKLKALQVEKDKLDQEYLFISSKHNLIFEKFEELTKLNEHIGILEALFNGLNNYTKAIEDLEKTNYNNQIEFYNNKIEELKNNIELINSATVLINKIEILFKKLDIENSNIDNSNKLLNDIKVEIDTYVKQLDEFEICPLCNSTLGGKHEHY